MYLFFFHNYYYDRKTSINKKGGGRRPSEFGNSKAHNVKDGLLAWNEAGPDTFGQSALLV